jgi:predicted nucleic acid-binding Zn ribbon protein
MRCNACGRHVDDSERMYNPTMLIENDSFAVQKLNAPLICEDCKPKFERKQNEMRRNGIWILAVSILVLIGLVLLIISKSK